MTTPVSDLLDDTAWNNLPYDGFLNGAIVRPLPFIALANEMMLYLVGASGEELNYVAGQTARINLAGQERVGDYTLTFPSGRERIEESQEDGRAIVYGPLKDLGHFHASVRAEVRGGFSVNIAPQESVLARVSEQDLKGMLGEAPFSMARDREQINRQLTETRVGHELFPLLIALAVLILAAEHILANRFYQEADRAGPASQASATIPASGGSQPPGHVAEVST
jgi:hypothetical protein